MRIHVHLTGFYEWVPVPSHVTVTKQDLAAGKARPSANGTGHVMRVPMKADTHNEIVIPENAVIAEIIRVYTDKGKCGHILTRHEAATEIVARTATIEFNRKHIVKFDVHDDGPSEELLRDMLKPHLEADHGRAPGKNVDLEDVEDIVEAYLTPAPHDAEVHAKMGATKDKPRAHGKEPAHAKGIFDHLHKHFIRPKKSGGSKEHGQ